MEAALPAHFLRALEKAGVKDVRIIGSRRSRVDLHIDDFLLEAKKDGRVQRTWCYVDQPVDGIRWSDKDANGAWLREVIE
jgi:hypothetical protein